MSMLRGMYFRQVPRGHQLQVFVVALRRAPFRLSLVHPPLMMVLFSKTSSSSISPVQKLAMNGSGADGHGFAVVYSLPEDQQIERQVES